MNDYLTLKGVKFRVEVNWNATTEFCELKGIKNLTKLDSIVNLSAADFRLYVFSCIKEGERMDGRSFEITPIELGSMMTEANIVQFIDIYKKQTIYKSSSDTGKVKKKKFLFR